MDSERSKGKWVCNWLSFSDLIKHDKDVMVYKMLYSVCPGSYRGKFHARPQISTYGKRNFHDIDIPKKRRVYPDIDIQKIFTFLLLNYGMSCLS